MAKKKDPPADNFAVRVKEVLLPGGAVAPPTSDLILVLSVCIVKHQRDVHDIAVSFGELDGFDFEKALPGCIYGCKANRRRVAEGIREQLMEFLEYRKESEQYYPTQEGWCTLSAPTFWLGDEFMPAVNNANLMLYTKSAGSAVQLAGKSLTETDALRGFAAAMQVKPHIRIPTFSFTAASYLKSIWDEQKLPLRSSLFICGLSGYGKSSLASTFSALCNDKDGKLADALSLESTDAATIDHCSNVRDRVVLLDDICRSTDPEERRKCMATAMRLVRYTSGELSVSKMLGKHNLSRVMEFGLVITSEILPNELSELTRCIMIHITEEHSGGNREERETAAACLRGYLSWFAQNYDREVADMAERIQGLPRNPYPGYERLFKGVFQLAWCWDSFCRYAREKGVTMPQAENCFRETLEHQIRLIEGDKEKLVNAVAVVYQNLLPSHLHKGHVCVKLDDLTAYLRQLTKRQDLTSSTVSELLRNHQMVDMDASGRVTKKIVGHRCVHLLPPNHWKIQNS